MAQVHRFRDSVAAWLGTGETVYMSPREARQLARALNKVARSVDRESFINSSGNTTSIEIGGNARGAWLARGEDDRALWPHKPA